LPSEPRGRHALNASNWLFPAIRNQCGNITQAAPRVKGKNACAAICLGRHSRLVGKADASADFADFADFQRGKKEPRDFESVSTAESVDRPAKRCREPLSPYACSSTLLAAVLSRSIRSFSKKRAKALLPKTLSRNIYISTNDHKYITQRLRPFFHENYKNSSASFLKLLASSSAFSPGGEERLIRARSKSGSSVTGEQPRRPKAKTELKNKIAGRMIACWS
jgi:hypothetical protein